MVLGMTQGIKGFFAFLSAPVLGALSDRNGRKYYLLLTVGATCAPLPFLLLDNMWFYVVVVALSGTCAVTFSIVFAYVSDVTEMEDRSAAFGQVRSSSLTRTNAPHISSHTHLGPPQFLRSLSLPARLALSCTEAFAFHTSIDCCCLRSRLWIRSFLLRDTA